jgi:hypothetical protein
MARPIVHRSVELSFATLSIAPVLAVALAESLGSSVPLAISGAFVVIAALSLSLVTRARFVAVIPVVQQRSRVHVADGPTSEMRQSDPGVPGRPRSRAPAVLSAL